MAFFSKKSKGNNVDESLLNDMDEMLNDVENTDTDLEFDNTNEEVSDSKLDDFDIDDTSIDSELDDMKFDDETFDDGFDTLDDIDGTVESIEDSVEDTDDTYDESETAELNEIESTEIVSDSVENDIDALDSDDNEQSKLDSESNETNGKPKDYVLYIVVDKYIPNMLAFFRSYGAKVSQVFTNINDARDTILMQTEPSRLIIVDTGTGRFTNMASRKALVDLMGICDEDTGISVFFTDSIIKSEVLSTDEVEDRLIDWYKYRSTSDILANILQKAKTENYIYSDDSIDDEVDDIESILDTKGLPVKCEKGMFLGAPTLKIEEIMLNMSNSTEESGAIPGYKIKI